MIDLIDREKLLNSRVYSIRSGKPNYEKMLKNLVNDILTAPTVDTERHAHWDIFRSNTERVDICSYCGSAFHHNIDSYKYNYCPICGCRMKEVEK